LTPYETARLNDPSTIYASARRSDDAMGGGDKTSSKCFVGSLPHVRPTSKVGCVDGGDIAAVWSAEAAVEKRTNLGTGRVLGKPATPTCANGCPIWMT